VTFSACRILILCATVVLGMPIRLSAQGDLLAGLNRAVESMVQQVSPSVVQIVVSKYDVQRGSSRSDVVDNWEQGIGSGVIVAPDGYIMTNAHVVEHALRIRVRMVPRQPQSVSDVLSQSFLRPLNATLVGTFADGDLALLKISAEGLPALPIADFDALRQGQVVFAFGSRSAWGSSARWPGSWTRTIRCSTSRPTRPSTPETAGGRW
jgi:serine protease Do